MNTVKDLIADGKCFSVNQLNDLKSRVHIFNVINDFVSKDKTFTAESIAEEISYISEGLKTPLAQINDILNMLYQTNDVIFNTYEKKEYEYYKNNTLVKNYIYISFNKKSETEIALKDTETQLLSNIKLVLVKLNKAKSYLKRFLKVNR